MGPIRRILIIRPSALGDVCRSVPLATSLHAAFPDAHIDWLVNAPYADAIRAHPAVHGVIPFDRSAGANRAARFATLLRHLRAARYDAVLDAQGLARSGVFSLATGAPIRIARRDAREGAAFAANRCVGDKNARQQRTHTVDAMLELLEPLGVPAIRDLSLIVPPEDADHAQNDTELGMDPNAESEPRPIVLAPTSLWPGKRWPIERFAALAERLSDRHPIVVVGSRSERPQCEPLLRMPGVVDRVGATTVGGLMAIIQRAALVVANDSAALHMAVGLDRPCVALFGPTRTELVGPYRRDTDVIQHIEPGDVFQHKNHAAGLCMMERISVDEVEAACVERLKKPDE